MGEWGRRNKEPRSPGFLVEIVVMISPEVCARVSQAERVSAPRREGEKEGHSEGTRALPRGYGSKKGRGQGTGRFGSVMD